MRAKLAITSGWLVEEVDEHTCGTDSGGHYGHHEPGCGQIPVLTVAELDALLLALSDLGIPINRAPEELPKLLATAEQRVAQRMRELAEEWASRCPPDDWPSGGMEDAVIADCGRAILHTLADVAPPTEAT